MLTVAYSFIRLKIIPPTPLPPPRAILASNIAIYCIIRISSRIKEQQKEQHNILSRYDVSICDEIAPSTEYIGIGKALLYLRSHGHIYTRIAYKINAIFFSQAKRTFIGYRLPLYRRHLIRFRDDKLLSN